MKRLRLIFVLLSLAVVHDIRDYLLELKELNPIQSCSDKNKESTGYKEDCDFQY